MISPPREVVITGVGVVSPIGIGCPAVLDSLTSGRSGVRSLEPFDSEDFPVRVGATVADFEGKQYVTPRKSLKVMSRGIQLGFAAAQMAYQDAGLSASEVSPERMGVAYGADMIHVDPEELASAFRICIENQEFQFDRWDARAMGEMFPLWLLKYLPNMPACHVAIALDARGPNNTIVLGEASSLSAIAEGMRVIERSGADVMVVGGVGLRIHPLSWMQRNPVLLSRRFDSPAEISRPFDARRDGMVYGEGAAVFVLESRQFAEARRAKIRARILSFASTFEACTPGQPFEGTAIRAAIKQSLRAARLDPKDLGHVNAHGLSTIEDDRAEGRAIRDTVGDVPVTALKSFFGNLGAGAGAVELLGTILAFETGQVPFTLNYEHEDPTCPINVIRDAPAAVSRQSALVLNQTLMGQSVAMVVAGPN